MLAKGLCEYPRPESKVVLRPCSTIRNCNQTVPEAGVVYERRELEERAGWRDSEMAGEAKHARLAPRWET